MVVLFRAAPQRGQANLQAFALSGQWYILRQRLHFPALITLLPLSRLDHFCRGVRVLCTIFYSRGLDSIFSLRRTPQSLVSKSLAVLPYRTHSPSFDLQSRNRGDYSACFCHSIYIFSSFSLFLTALWPSQQTILLFYLCQVVSVHIDFLFIPNVSAIRIILSILGVKSSSKTL